ncbi:MAG TPA: TetR/AcrR family transcriptional regulator [Actinomycetota bacterium]|jgi:AcrR family transcriptional regulator
MPKIGATVQAERRQNLIDAAWRCARRRGFRELTVDEICSEAGASKGAFYGYFPSKQDMQFALLEADARSLDELMVRLAGSRHGAVERIRRFARAALEQSADPGRVQVRADLWADMLHEPGVRERFADTMSGRRALLRSWIDEAIADGELKQIPANALAAILLSLSDGLMLHAALNPDGFKWANVRLAIDAILGDLAERDE